MAIVRVHNKARNITYVYESESYWDKELKQPRSHRKLIGRIDPATGDVVPTSRKARDEESAFCGGRRPLMRNPAATRRI